MVSSKATVQIRSARDAVLALWLLGWALFIAPACAPPPIQYFYDANGRLVAVMDTGNTSTTDATGGSAIYNYDLAGNLTSITRQTITKLSIFSFTPDCGLPGTTVTIYGSGFSTTASNNSVNFSCGTATATSATATQLVVAVPASCPVGGGGSLTVSVSGGTPSAPSSQQFSVGCGAPTITSFSPAAGNPGDTVTMTGTNFDTMPTNDRVTFNSRFGAVVSSPAPTATQLSAQAPTNATSGKIAVTTPGGTAVSMADFFVPPPCCSYTVGKIDLTHSGRMSNPISAGSTASVTVTSDQSIVLTLFDEVQNDRVCGYLTNDPVGVHFRLFDPVGTQLWATDCTAGCTPPTYSSPAIPLGYTGTYTWVVEPYTGQTGMLTFTVYRVDPDIMQTVPACTAVPCSPYTINITTACQLASLTFPGTAGHRVSATATNPSPSSFSWSYKINDPSNQYVGLNYGTNCSILQSPNVLGSSGTYTLLFYPGDRQTGSVGMRVYDVVDASTPITIGSNPVTQRVTARTPGEKPKVTFQARTSTLSASWPTPTFTSSENATGPPTMRLYDDTTGQQIASTSTSPLNVTGLTPGHPYHISADFWQCSTGYTDLTITN